MRSDFMFSPKCSAFWEPSVNKQYSPMRLSSRTLRLRNGARKGVTTVKDGRCSDGEGTDLPEVRQEVPQ